MFLDNHNSTYVIYGLENEPLADFSRIFYPTCRVIRKSHLTISKYLSGQVKYPFHTSQKETVLFKLLLFCQTFLTGTFKRMVTHITWEVSFDPTLKDLNCPQLQNILIFNLKGKRWEEKEKMKSGPIIVLFSKYSNLCLTAANQEYLQRSQDSKSY